MFFSEQQVVSESSWSPDKLPPPTSGVATSETLLNPLFIARLIIWIILLSLFVAALMDVMLKFVFYTRATSVYFFSSSKRRQKSRYFITDHTR